MKFLKKVIKGILLIKMDYHAAKSSKLVFKIIIQVKCLHMHVAMVEAMLSYGLTPKMQIQSIGIAPIKMRTSLWIVQEVKCLLIERATK